MKIIIEKAPEEYGECSYMARSIESKDKKIYTRLLGHFTEYENWHIHDVEYFHKEKCLEIILPEHPWKIKRKSDEYFF
tara:strand:- start:234 stop:467 length:234 start_codon:yes stop_codon:yes gene_type:complete